MQIYIRQESFDPWRELIKYQNNETNPVLGFGATSVFVGTMRDYNEQENVTEMTLEHYPKMTERHLHLEKCLILNSRRKQKTNWCHRK